ncbi:MAG: RNA-binding S4 domain-containing protein [Clostridiales bacterium]|jgi:ribosomal 50S subunit-recycling heat shock protein|nr:RNA-binding S4 domain-containing protein [Clostridiales bacterium]
MRLDKFLKVSRILKRRTVAASACLSNKVCVNSQIAKPGKQLKLGDIVEISFAQNTLIFEVLKLNSSTKKNDATDMYKILSDTNE